MNLVTTKKELKIVEAIFEYESYLGNFGKVNLPKKKKADLRVNFVLGSLYFVRTYVRVPFQSYVS